MKAHWILFFLLFSCFQKENLDYPTDIGTIKEITFEKPDEKSHGKFALVRDLNKEEIAKLLEILKDAKPIGIKKFKPDYYIVFRTSKGYQRLKVSGNQIKGYESDLTYRIENLEMSRKF